MATVSGVPLIGGFTFDFTEGGYLPPTWSGAVYSFASSILNQVWTDDDYVYAATNVGVAVIDITTE